MLVVAAAYRRGVPGLCARAAAGSPGWRGGGKCFREAAALCSGRAGGQPGWS